MTKLMDNDKENSSRERVQRLFNKVYSPNVGEFSFIFSVLCMEIRKKKLYRC